MDFSASGIHYWVWILCWISIVGVLWTIRRGHKRARKNLDRFGRVGTLFRLIPDEIWRSETDAEKAQRHDPAYAVKSIRRNLRSRRRIKEIILVMALILIVIAVGRPRWGVKQEDIFQKGIDIVLLIDVSLSMKAQDIAPSRLDKAKSEIATILSMLENNRVGLVSFATSTRLHCPLTLDFRGLRSILDHSLSVGPGTNIANAVSGALRVLNKSDARSKAVILFSDGEGHDGDISEVTRELNAAGVHLFCVGIGTLEGGPIPEVSEEGSSGYKKSQGELIWTKLDEDSLKQLAVNTGGAYFRATDMELEAIQLTNAINSLEKTEFSQTVTTRKEERFAVFLLIAVILLALEAGLGDFRAMVWEDE